jgi:hypothetical protein
MAARRFRRELVFAAAVVWILLLSGLTLWTANPVTLNRDQILIARSTGAVMIAKVVSGKTGQVKVEDVLAAVDGLPEEIATGRELTVGLLSEIGAKEGDRVVLPVVVRPAGNVMLAPTPAGVALAYPATQEVVDAVKQLITAK